MSVSAAPPPDGQPLRVLGYAVNGPGDELALRMLAQVVSDLPISLDVTTNRVLASELVEHVRVNGYCIDLFRRPAAEHVVENALSREAAPRRAA